MKLHVTPDLMEMAYEYFRATRPFGPWKLPPGDEVEFMVTRNSVTAGYCRSTFQRPQGRWLHEIGVSSVMVTRTHNLFEVIAHEMVHAHCDRLGIKAHHGSDFRRLCAQVAKHHGFNPLNL
jgi:hypothetical protein